MVILKRIFQYFSILAIPTTEKFIFFFSRSPKYLQRVIWIFVHPLKSNNLFKIGLNDLIFFFFFLEVRKTSLLDDAQKFFEKIATGPKKR